MFDLLRKTFTGIFNEIQDAHIQLSKISSDSSYSDYDYEDIEQTNEFDYVYDHQHLLYIANTLLYVGHYFMCDVPIFNYKNYTIYGNGLLIANTGCMDKNNICTIDAHKKIDDIYEYLICYTFARTKHNYPILIYKDFIWKGKYIYSKSIRLSDIMNEGLYNGPETCILCKEYCDTKLHIFYQYCECCNQEILSKYASTS